MYPSASSSGRLSNPRYSDYDYRSPHRREYDHNEEEDEFEREREDNYECVSSMFSRTRICYSNT
jgi:hypothetical protein